MGPQGSVGGGDWFWHCIQSLHTAVYTTPASLCVLTNSLLPQTSPASQTNRLSPVLGLLCMLSSLLRYPFLSFCTQQKPEGQGLP